VSGASTNAAVASRRSETTTYRSWTTDCRTETDDVSKRCLIVISAFDSLRMFVPTRSRTVDRTALRSASENLFARRSVIVSNPIA